MLLGWILGRKIQSVEKDRGRELSPVVAVTTMDVMMDAISTKCLEDYLPKQY